MVPLLLKIATRDAAEHEASVWHELSKDLGLYSSIPGLAGPIKLLTLKVGLHCMLLKVALFRCSTVHDFQNLAGADHATCIALTCC